MYNTYQLDLIMESLFLCISRFFEGNNNNVNNNWVQKFGMMISIVCIYIERNYFQREFTEEQIVLPLFLECISE